METGQREMGFFLSGPERRLLTAIARRLPAWLTPDHLTSIGVAGSGGTAAAYALSRFDPGWLWVASLMLAVQWFGDSLDGTLARVRRAERPRYGYYLDHVVDVFSTMAIGAGIGLSPYVGPELALLLVIGYLALSINVYLETSVFGVFRMAYSRVGPTETRIALIAVNALLALGPRPGDPLWDRFAFFTNTAAGILAAAMFALLLWRLARNLRQLSRMEPYVRG